MDINPRLGTWVQPGQTQTADTAIKIPITPYPGPAGSAPLRYRLDSQGTPNFMKPQGGVTHLTQFVVTCGSTAHVHYFMRPLNYAVVSTAGAINSTSLVIDKDPGVYSTNYRYPIPDSQTVANTANNAIAANDYFAVQLSDGTWFFDKVAGVSGSGAITITTTTTIPNVTGGGIPVGSIFYWFGIQTDTDPATGLGHPSFQPAASATFTGTDPGGDGLVNGLRPGDPLYYFNANATAADTVVYLAGYYGKF